MHYPVLYAQHRNYNYKLCAFHSVRHYKNHPILRVKARDDTINPVHTVIYR